MERDDNSEQNNLKRSAFDQYFAISQEMTAYEKELFAKFQHEGTFEVNNVLKRKILTLKFGTVPEELRDEMIRKDVPQSTSLSKIQKASRASQQKPRQSMTHLKAPSPRWSLAKKPKFNVFSRLIQWTASRPGADNPDVTLAEKLMKASESSTSLSKSVREARSDFKIQQAKRKIGKNSLNYDRYLPLSSGNDRNSDDNSNPTEKHPNMEGSHRRWPARRV